MASKFKIKILFSFLLLFVGLRSYADLGLLYKSEAEALLQKISQMGYTHFVLKSGQRLSLNAVRQHLAKNPFAEVPMFIKPPTATRSSAFYIKESGYIYVRSESDLNPENIGLLGLHEILGALHVDEYEYKLTLLTLAALKVNSGQWGQGPSDRKLLKQEVFGQNTVLLRGSEDETKIQKANNSYHGSNWEFYHTARGGVTIFGGGGDLQSLGQRIRFYDYINESYKRCSGNLRNAPLEVLLSESINIEVLDTDQGQISYVYGPQESLLPRHILVPFALTQQPPQRDLEAPNRALEDIAFYFASIGRYRRHLCQFGIKWKILRSENFRDGFFSFPEDLDKIHPQARQQLFDPLEKKKCPHQKCQPLTLPTRK